VGLIDILEFFHELFHFFQVASALIVTIVLDTLLQEGSRRRTKSGSCCYTVGAGSEKSSTLSTVGRTSGNGCYRLKVRSQEFISGYHLQGYFSIVASGRRGKGRDCHGEECANDNGAVVEGRK